MTGHAVRAGRLSIPRRRFWRDALKATAMAALVFAWVFLVQGDFFHDARAYWSVDYADMYSSSLVGRPATYLYSPALAHLIWPLTILPWQVFAAFFCAINLALLIWMVGPILAAVLVFLPFSPVTDEITTGNIHLLIAAAIVLGFRYPSAHALPLLTKVTPGVGVLWFAGAGRWKAFAVALGTTVGLALVSFAIAPQAWLDWFGLLRESSSVPVPSAIGVIPGPLWLRTLLAAALVLAGGRLGWRWTVPIAAVLALPVTWSSGLSILVALIPLVAHRERDGERARARLPKRQAQMG